MFLLDLYNMSFKYCSQTSIMFFDLKSLNLNPNSSLCIAKNISSEKEHFEWFVGGFKSTFIYGTSSGILYFSNCFLGVFIDIMFLKFSSLDKNMLHI